MLAVLALGLSLVQTSVAQSITAFTATPYAFNSQTGSAIFTYTLTDVTDGSITLKIQDSQATVVRTLTSAATQTSGSYNAPWDGKDEASQAVPEGIYTATLTASIPGGGEISAQTNVLVDNTKPILTINVPKDGASYTLNQPVSADYSCSDPGTSPSGVQPENCAGTVASASNIDTSTMGSQTFTVTATDNADNTATQTVTYNVAYKFSGFLPPLKVKGKQQTLQFKPGSTIPVKFQLTDNNGNYLSTATAQIWVDSKSSLGKSSGRANKDNNFRYDTTSNQYIFNLSTKGLAKGSHMIYVTLDDGTTYSVNITLK
jgi:hypothetical protein